MPFFFNFNKGLLMPLNEGSRLRAAYEEITPEEQLPDNRDPSNTKESVNYEAMNGSCPIPACRGDIIDISYGNFEYLDRQITQTARCLVCDATWVEKYDFVGVKNLCQPTGIPVTMRRAGPDVGMRYTQISPWEVKPLENGHYYIDNINARFNYLTKKGWSHKVHAENVGNIKLIKYAPEMFNALISASKILNNILDEDDEIRVCIYLLVSKIKSMVPDGF